jgi:hypothetical protein
LNFIFGIVCLFVCVCAFSLRRESPDMILGDKTPYFLGGSVTAAIAAADTALASDGQRPRAPNIARRVLVDPLHGQRDGDAPTPRHLLHLRVSLLDAPRRHGATAIFMPPSPAPNAQPPPLPIAPKCPPATLPPAPTSGAAAFRPDWIGNAATDSPSAPRLDSFFFYSAGLSSPG